MLIHVCFHHSATIPTAFASATQDLNSDAAAPLVSVRSNNITGCLAGLSVKVGA